MKNQKRGKNVAIVALVLQAVLVAACLAIWRWTGAQSLLSAALMAAGGLLVWTMVAMLFYARQLVQTEQLELEEIHAQGAASSLFDEADRLAGRPAKAKLEFMEKWVLPLFTLVLAGYYIGIGWWLLSIIGPLTVETGAPVPSNPHAGLLLIVLGFGGFLWSRYALGMSTEADWRALRAPASLLFVHVLFLVLVVIEMAMVYWGKGALGEGTVSLDRLVASILPMVMFVFAAEILINLVLDLYRPRLPGQESRISFDSRLFNFLAQPEQVGHSLADALNYQFGFQVSKTWFYQLVSRAVLPLLVFAAVVLDLMTCVVIVQNDQKAVVLRLGEFDPGQEPLGPGVHLKLPWPIDTVRFFNTGDVKKVVLGIRESAKPRYLREVYVPGTKTKRVLLWQQDHEGEKSLLLAQSPQQGQTSATSGVALGKIVFVVSYRISDVYEYGFKYENPDQLIENIAMTAMTQLGATSTLLEPEEQLPPMDPMHPRSLMTVGREHATRALRKRIEDSLAQRGGLGVEITHVGLSSVHPPSGAASAFEDVVKAQLSMLTEEYKAEGDAAEALAAVAGDPLIARLLAQAIDTQQKLTELRGYLQSTPPDLAEFNKAVDSYIHQSSQHVQMHQEKIDREKLLGRLKQARIEEVRQRVDAGQATLDDLAHEDVNDTLVMLLAYQRQLDLLQRIKQWAQDPACLEFEEVLARTSRRIDTLFAEAYGEPAKLIAQARAERRRLELTERTRAESFQRRLTAWRASPAMYELDRRLEIIERKLPQLDLQSKIVVGIDPEKVQVWSDRRQQGEALSEIPWGQLDQQGQE
jgi:regulator of protease activity HflC (stomatin/prohibitin superfamily)